MEGNIRWELPAVIERPRKIKLSFTNPSSRRLSRIAKRNNIRHRVQLLTDIEIKQKELEKKPFRCTIEDCDYAARLKSYLENHMKRMHANKGLFPCKLCSEKFKTQKSLYKHVFDHDKELGNASNEEIVNGKATFTPIETSKVQKERKGLLSCKYCPKKFRLAYKFKEHEDVHKQQMNKNNVDELSYK